MKKKFIITMLLMILIVTENSSVFAREMWNPPWETARDYQLIFLKVKDEYMLLYNARKRQPAGTVAIRANFWTDFNGRYYEQIYMNPDGVLYLTCNGTYIIEYLDAGFNVIAETKHIVTKKIQYPACSSYQKGGLQNDYNLSGNRTNGQTTLNWNPVSGADRYDIYADGETLLGSTTNTNYTTNHNASNYTVVAVDSNGNPIGTSDYYNDNLNDDLEGEDSGGGNNSGGCNGCKLITDMLACPAWDEYMNEWKSMLQEVYQPPNWQEVANIMRDTIVPAMGQELINRSPEMAEIFADEFTSREKQVAPPPPRPADYEPPQQLPQLQDLANEIEFDLTKDVPNFEPDFSHSEPFTIPNPLDLNLSDDDIGYIFDTEAQPQQKDYTSAPLPNDITYDAGSKVDSDIPPYNKDESAEMPHYNKPNDEVKFYEGGR